MSFARQGSLSRDRFPVALLFSGLFLAACLMPAQSDTWWQLRAGEWTWQSGQPMLRDEFTHTVAGQPWPGESRRNGSLIAIAKHERVRIG